MVKVEIEVDHVLTVGVHLEDLEPGDRLLVMNGLVVASIGKAQVRVAKTPEPTPPAPSKPNRTWIDYEPRLLAMLRGKPMTTTQMAGQLNISQDDRGGFRWFVGRLKDRGLIEPTSDDRRPAYRTRVDSGAAEVSTAQA